VRTFPQFVLVYSAVVSVMVALATMCPTSSVSAGSKSKARGAELFATRGCAHCHGSAGVGGRVGPDLQLVRNRLKKSQINLQIHNGGKSMPAYGDQLSSAQIDDLVDYLRAKRKVILPIPKPAAEAPISEPDSN
jgi:mono/diheme cytochrome c family protein